MADADYKFDDLIPLKEAARLLPLRRDGRPAQARTLRGWAAHGYREIKLKTRKIGSSTYTSERWIREFIARVSDAS